MTDLLTGSDGIQVQRGKNPYLCHLKRLSFVSAEPAGAIPLRPDRAFLTAINGRQV